MAQILLNIPSNAKQQLSHQQSQDQFASTDHLHLLHPRLFQMFISSNQPQKFLSNSSQFLKQLELL